MFKRAAGYFALGGLGQQVPEGGLGDPIDHKSKMQVGSRRVARGAAAPDTLAALDRAAFSYAPTRQVEVAGHHGVSDAPGVRHLDVFSSGRGLAGDLHCAVSYGEDGLTTGAPDVLAVVARPLSGNGVFSLAEG